MNKLFIVFFGLMLHFVIAAGSYAGLNEFSVIIGSDPQLWWQIDGEPFSDSDIETHNKNHRNAMEKLIAGNGLPQGSTNPTALIMNGDLTEYGRWVQWDAYNDIYGSIGVQIYNGLGNHEYANNASGCGAMAEDIAQYTALCAAFGGGWADPVWGQAPCSVINNMAQEGSSWCANDVRRRMEYWLQSNSHLIKSYDPGSVAYSFEMRGVHFIQLNNYPTYSVPEIGISSSINWLKADLSDAVSRNKWIVINMHDMADHFKGYQNTEFINALKGSENNIMGIFSGHLHAYAGYAKDISGSFADVNVNGRNIPWFFSGSSDYSIFNLVSFNSTGMTVQPIDSNSGTPVYYSGKTRVSSDVGGGTAILTAPKTVQGLITPVDDNCREVCHEETVGCDTITVCEMICE